MDRVRTVRGGWIAKVVLAACLLGVAPPACGRSHRHHVGFGAMEIRNSAFSFEWIESVYVSEDFGSDAFFYDPHLAPGEGFVVGALDPGSYTVGLSWSDGSHDTFLDVEVYPDSTTLVLGEN